MMGTLRKKHAKDGGGLSALRIAVEAEKGSMKTIFEPVFCLRIQLPFKE